MFDVFSFALHTTLLDLAREPVDVGIKSMVYYSTSASILIMSYITARPQELYRNFRTLGFDRRRIGYC